MADLCSCGCGQKKRCADTTKAFSGAQTQAMSRGYVPEWSEGAVIPPVFRTSTFVFKNCEEGKRAFELEYGLSPAKEGELPALIYTRVNNPNIAFVEDRITCWDDKAEAAALLSSGMGAISTSILAFLRPGDSLVFTDPVYGGTELLFRKVLPSFGIKTFPIPAGSSEEVMEKTVAETGAKVLYLETPSNPTIQVTDIAAASRVCKKLTTPEKRVMLFVDNTFLGPVFCQPHQFGADVVVYSATKFINGHSDVVAGICTGSKADIGAIKATRCVLGSINQPDSAWLITRSLPTLELRMLKAQENAVEIAKMLQAHPAVEKVFYPGSRDIPPEQQHLFDTQYNGTGSIITFLCKGGEKEAFTVLDNLHHYHLAVSLGGVETLIEHPSTMTHSDMTPEEKAHAGITDNMIRISVGIEYVKDLLEDLEKALDLIK